MISFCKNYVVKYYLLCILISFHVFEVGYSQVTENLVFTHHSHGLEGKTVTCFAKDALGFLWIGTDKGLCRYDGNEVISADKLYPESNLNNELFITCIYQDSKNQIWIGVRNRGLIKLTREGDNFTEVNLGTSNSASLTGRIITLIFEDPLQRLWVCARDLFLLDQASGEVRMIKPNVSRNDLQYYNNWQTEFQAVYNDPCSDFSWFQTGFGMCRLDLRSLQTKYYYHDTVKIAMRGSCFDGVENIWLSTFSDRVYKFNIRKEKFEEIIPDKHKLLANKPVSASRMAEYDSIHLLMASPKSGLLLYNRSDNTVIPLGQRFLQKDSVRAPFTLYRDADSCLWIGTVGNGIHKTSPKLQLIKDRFLGTEIEIVLEHPVSGLLYAATSDGRIVEINEKESCKRYFRTVKAENEDVSFIDLEFNSRHELWALSYYSLFRIDISAGMAEKMEIPDLSVANGTQSYYWDFTFDSKDQIWLSSQSAGLFCIDSRNYKVINYKYNPGDSFSLFHDYSISPLCCDRQGNLWGATENGIFAYHPANRGFYNTSNPCTYSVQFIGFTGSRAMQMDKEGNIWVTANADRVARLSRPEELLSPLQHVMHIENGYSGQIRGFLIDKGGQFYFSTDRGLMRMNASDMRALHFGEDYGIKKLNKLSCGKNGSIFAAGEEGYSVIDPNKLNTHYSSTISILSKFKIFDSLVLENISGVYPEEIQLNYRQNFLSFEMSSSDLQSTGTAEFAYRLRGLEDDWVKSGQRNYAAYTNLSGGEYEFQFMARRGNGQWGKYVTISLIVIPPFWETLWFWLIAIMSFLLLVYWVYRYRIDQIRKEEELKSEFARQIAEIEMKALKAQMNPHFLFNALNAIKYYVLRQDKEKAADYLTDFSRLIRLVLNNSNKGQIPLREEIEALELYIKIEQLRFDNSFHYEMMVDQTIDLENFLITPMIIQPYVENAIWHGLMHKRDGVGKMLIRFDRTPEGICCVVEDNGIGRVKAAEVKSKSAQREKSMGMTINHNRMNISKTLHETEFRLRIEDLYNEVSESAGTRIVLQINPLRTEQSSFA